MTTLDTLKALGINTGLLTRHADLADARRAARGFNDVRLVVMGDDDRYWVVSAREAAALRKTGYETI